MEAVEEEFLAEREHVQIIPNFSHDKLYLIAGDVGPFVAGIPCSVPLWLAVNLRQRGKCRLLPPAWMEAEALAAKKEEEMQTKVFTKMGSENYMAVAQLLLTTAPHDVPNAHLVRTLIKDIWDLRIAKLRSSVAEFIKQSGRHARLHHLTPMELHSVRPILPSALDQLLRLGAAASGAHNVSLNDSSMA
ncbi:probable DNA replication complex GINS protein PSF2 [Hyalella azteca]|uniref:DNA replication complex GINS protein PSF2 n=1 Tax=Hyalella azteca TaxID=294128 RepID=A0A8B7PN29_HYAAZ|nr:probable DNA replication complex GINS protein PSF2 [Hyalella azteca]